MSTPLIPQEIYLLERYSSLECFGEMRDAWAQVVAVVDEALEHFSAKLPADLSKRHLSEQYDIVWGGLVLGLAWLPQQAFTWPSASQTQRPCQCWQASAA